MLSILVIWRKKEGRNAAPEDIFHAAYEIYDCSYVPHLNLEERNEEFQKKKDIAGVN
jgi:hypothetical protein